METGDGDAGNVAVLEYIEGARFSSEFNRVLLVPAVERGREGISVVMYSPRTEIDGDVLQLISSGRIPALLGPYPVERSFTFVREGDDSDVFSAHFRTSLSLPGFERRERVEATININPRAAHDRGDLHYDARVELAVDVPHVKMDIEVDPRHMPDADYAIVNSKKALRLMRRALSAYSRD